MAFSYDVRFWNTRRKEGKRRPYEVRWVVGGEEHSRSHTTGPLADSFKSQLIQAARRGEGFDVATGLPESMLRLARAITWFELATQYADTKWDGAAAKTRESMGDGLASVTAALVTTTRGAPDHRVLRRVLARWAFNPNARATRELDEEEAAAIEWLEKHSVQVTDLDDPERRADLIRQALGCLSRLLDGKPAAATTIARRRATFHGALEYAREERNLLTSNPLDKVSWKAPKTTDVVDRRVVASPRQAGALLAAVRARRPDLTAFYGCLYYAMCRPAEARALRRQDCDLPAEGWGYLTLTGSVPQTGQAWTDTGETYEHRELKHRARHAVRVVPIPPVLVRMLHDHLETFGTARDGRLFRTPKDGQHILSTYTYGRTWKSIRTVTLTAEQVASPLASRPYDLRHAGITWRLNSGVPATDVAAWAGHSVEVMLRIYAGCIDEHHALWLRRMDEALADQTPEDEDQPEATGTDQQRTGVHDTHQDESPNRDHGTDAGPSDDRDQAESEKRQLDDGTAQ
jgi:integrase